MADVKRRPAPDSLQRIGKRKFNRSPYRRRHPHPTPELGLARILRTLLSGSAAANRRRPSTEQAASEGFSFLPLHGERDEQHEVGLTIPFARWTFDVSNFRTGARNFFDHDVLGNSNIFFPLTLERARIRGWEATANSPMMAGRAQFHLAYSHQYAQWNGGVTGGLISDEACEKSCASSTTTSATRSRQASTSLSQGGRRQTSTPATDPASSTAKAKTF